MATKKMNAELILQKLAEMRKSMPFLDEASPRPANRARSDGRMTDLDGFPLRTEEDFEYAAVADGLQSLADDISAAVDEKRAAMVEQALEVYYTAEELARDPEHADLIPHVEKMRAAYEHDHGHPIPPRPPRKP
jgi:hypothetical protein